MTPSSLAPPPGETGLDQSVPAELEPESRTILPHSSRRILPSRLIGPPLWISAGAHLLVLLGLLLYLRYGPEATPMRRPAGMQVIEYVDLSRLDVPTPAPDTEAQSGEDTPAAPAEPAATAEGAQAPRGAVLVPGGVPGVITSEGGEAPAVAPSSGGGSTAERLRPGFSDPRLYADPEIARMRQPRQSDIQRYREHLQRRVDALNDSMYGGGANTDWTFKDGSGNRWGISEDGVHLGPVTIPRALIPAPAPSGTNQDLEEARERQRQRDEIQRQEADREVRRARQESQEAARQRREQQRAAEPEGGG